MNDLMSDADNPSDPLPPKTAAAWLALWNCLSASLELLQQELTAAAREQQLSPEAARVLYYLGHHTEERLNQRRLARWMRVSPAKMSGLLESLRQQSLVHPERDAHDRRSQSWSLTTGGHTTCQALRQQLDTAPLPVELFEQLVRIVPQLAKQFAQSQLTDDGRPLIRHEGRAA